MKLSFTLLEDQVFTSHGLDLAATEIVGECIQIAESSLRAARSRMVTIAKVDANLLPIAVGMDIHHLEVSLLMTDDVVDSEKTNMLRKLGQLAKESNDMALTHLAAPVKALPPGPDSTPASTANVTPATLRTGHTINSWQSDASVEPNPFDKVAANLAASLSKKNRQSEVKINLFSSVSP